MGVIVNKQIVLNPDQLRLLTTFVYGQVIRHLIDMSSNVNEETVRMSNVMEYSESTLRLALEQLQGNTSMGPNYSDFQCVAVPQAVEFARSLAK